MTNLGTFLGDMLLRVKVFGLAAPPGEPPLQQAQLSVVGEDASLGIPVLKGDTGPAGAAAAPFKWQWPALDSASELPTLTNTTDDKGKAYVVKDGYGTADIAYWTGTEWKYFVDAFGPGLPGPAPDITVDGEQVDEDDPFDVVVSGTTANPHLHFKIPKVPGPTGPSGPWNLYDSTKDRDAGDIPVWNETESRFEPKTWMEIGSFPRVRRYTQPESAFTAYSGSSTSQLISTMALPALEYAYHVDVHGHVRCGPGLLSSAQVAVVVRMGDQTTGQIVGKALPEPGAGARVISPHYSSQASGQTGYASSPDSAVGRVAANQAQTLYVVAQREAGSGQWYANQVDAQLSVTLIPAEG
ncbi:hypothetical protein RND64_04380 [Gordonia sp. w5E2]|uniref:hypothetical protein n=1 Tax=Gordonia sp. w5E2 TaxID=3075837 RepID=UPI002F407E19